MTENIFRHKSIDELTFTDDGMFQEVLRNLRTKNPSMDFLIHTRIFAGKNSLFAFMPRPCGTW